MSESYLLLINDTKSKGFFLALLRLLLFFLSCFYHSITVVRDKLYRLRFFKSYRSSCYVISIGNIVAGGTGKTPLTLFLSQKVLEFSDMAIISRGYRSKFEKKRAPTILSHGKGPCFSPKHCGDEPYLISKNLPKALFIVGRNRTKGLKLAEEKGIKIVILDDAMQHRKVARDQEIVVLDASNLFGYDHFLPRGCLREHPKSLKRASLIVINHTNDIFQVPAIKKSIKKYSEAPLVFIKPVLGEALTLDGRLHFDLAKNIKAAVFTAIAKPSHFLNDLKALKVDVGKTFLKKDHAVFSEKELKKLCQIAINSGCKVLICTEKDSVKVRHDIDLPLPVIYLPMGFSIVSGEQHLEDLIKKVKSNL